MMANSITSLRTIAHLDWRDVRRAAERDGAVLREDPAGATRA
jgi:hypothetical protein